MTHLLVVGSLIFVVAVAMTMVGKGGGNFYVVILAMAGIPMHTAATTGQFILFAASLAAMIIFHRSKSLSWKLALIIGTLTSLSAFGGGYFSYLFSGSALKMIFAVMLIAAGAVMLVPFSGKKAPARVTEGATLLLHPSAGILNISSGGELYRVNLWLVVPVTLLTGFSSGMVGVSGGSFLVPLMVLAAGVTMHTAVGTASTLIAATAFMGFTGHALQGDFDPAWALPLAAITIIGGILGGKFSLKTRPKHLKQLFAYTNWLAAAMMIANALMSG